MCNICVVSVAIFTYLSVTDTYQWQWMRLLDRCWISWIKFVYIWNCMSHVSLPLFLSGMVFRFLEISRRCSSIIDIVNSSLRIWSFSRDRCNVGTSEACNIPTVACFNINKSSRKIIKRRARESKAKEASKRRFSRYASPDYLVWQRVVKSSNFITRDQCVITEQFDDIISR